MRTAVHPAGSEIPKTGSLAVVLSLVVGSLVSLGLFLVATSWESRWIQQEFSELAGDRALAVEREFSHRAAQVHQVSGYFAGSEYVSGAEFRTYISRMAVGHGQGWLVQWVPYVRQAERAAYESRARSEGRPDFVIAETDVTGQLVPAGERAEYFPVYYQQPKDLEGLAPGLDLATCPDRFAVLRKAIETGKIAVSPRLTYLSQGSDYSVFLIVAPVFRAEDPADSAPSARENLIGLVIGVLRIQDFLDRALRYSPPRGVIVQVEDPPQRGAPPSCWQYEAQGRLVQEIPLSAVERQRRDSLSRSESIRMGDQQWRVTCTATRGYKAAHGGVSRWVLLALGLAVTGAVANSFRKTSEYTRGLMEINRRLVLEVAERERIASSLKENERFLSALLANLPGMVYRCRNDHDWTTVFASEGCLPLTGYSPADLIENARVSFAELMHPDDRAGTWDKVQAALTRRTEFELTYRIRTAQGTEKWVWERGRGAFSAEGNLVFIEGFVADITEQKHIENELARYREHLETRVAERTRQLDESRERLRRSEHLASIGTLAAGIAHEINNPVGTILLAAENALELRKMHGSEAVVDDCLKGIVSEARRCGAVIQGVLQFAQQERAPKTPASIESVLRRCVERIAVQAREMGAIMDVHLAPGLPDIPLNALQMEQAFVNLLRNALEAGGKGVRVVLRASVVDERLRVTVCDNGPGIPKEHLPRIFDPFFTTRRERGGTGLGLSLAHGIVVEHGGQISVQSQLGVGTTFVVDLPLGKPDESEGSHGQDIDR
ncbi:MAG: CHASE domain-containing protein [Phycisphaerae bacterium]|nr:CHASE domain-containing protein [Phycisphaerae bacterium]